MTRVTMASFGFRADHSELYAWLYPYTEAARFAMVTWWHIFAITRGA